MCELFCPDLNLLFNSLRTTMTSWRTTGCRRRQLAAPPNLLDCRIDKP